MSSHATGAELIAAERERLAALDTLRALIEKGERDTSLLDGRDHDPARYEEAYRLLDLLRAREEREVGR